MAWNGGKSWGGKGWGKGGGWGKDSWGKGGGWGKDSWGGGGDWGVQKPWMKKGGKGPIPAAPSDFKVSPTKRFTGTVQSYYKLSGYGFITLSQTGLVPQDKLFVHWTNIKSADRFPSLMKDTQVEFNIRQEEKKGTMTIGAYDVSMPGGAQITLQDESDGKKTFVGGQNVRYTGKLKFFLPKRGYGYITLDDGYQFQEDVGKELRVELAEVNAGGKQPSVLKDMQVEFGIWKTQKGSFKAYNMTAPGGVPLPTEEEAGVAA